MGVGGGAGALSLEVKRRMMVVLLTGAVIMLVAESVLFVPGETVVGAAKTPITLQPSSNYIWSLPFPLSLLQKLQLLFYELAPSC